MIQPSLLEYSRKKLAEKLNFARSNRDKLQDACFQEMDLTLHIDIVGKSFAQSRGVMMSNNFNTVFDTIKKCSVTDSLFTSHFMYEGEDFKLLWKSVDLIYRNRLNLIENQNSFYFFIDEKYISKINEYIKSLKITKLIKVGAWYDIHQWPGKEIKIDSLLMTVAAGKSGQKLSKETIKNANETIKLSKYKLIFDGGINYENINQFDANENTDFVSYTAAWNKLQQ